MDFPDVPVVSLSISGNRRTIQEGTDVFFDCQIRANPSHESVGWTFEHRPIHADVTRGINISNQSLILTAVKRSHSGKYSCSGTNSEGKGKSHEVYLDIQCMFNDMLFFFHLLLSNNLLLIS